ncbi:MAG: DUF1304 domain-containing protein [Rhodocyclaceae bacterium]
MSFAAAAAITLIALLHVWILVLEMFLWDKPLGLRTFRHTPEDARTSRVLAANQGLYNGFLAAGLFWSVWLGDAGREPARFFMLCVLVAGLYGAWSTGKPRIFWVQGLPALIGLMLLQLS